ncbi:MAG TPA: SDR family oxidoreductase [Sphingobacteriaceae bacterium]
MNAIITGATKGMGRAIAGKLAASRYDLFLCARNQAELEEFWEELLAAFPDVSVFIKATDVGDQAQLSAFTEFVLSHTGHIDVLINNAGLFIPATVLSEGADVLQQQLAVNVSAPHFLCRTFGNLMKDRRSGHIINICSIAALNPVVTAGSYSVTKFALLGLTRVLREELMAYGVKVTAILPGSTLTGSWTGTTLPPDRFVDANDIADAVMTCLAASKGGNIDEIIIRPTQGNI